MAKLTDKKLCDICERIVKIKRLQDGSGLTEDIFKSVKKAKLAMKDLSPVGKKLVKDLVKAFNAGKMSLESAIKEAEPIVKTTLSTKSGGAFTAADRSQSIGSGAVLAGEGIKPAEQNLPLGTSTSFDSEGGVVGTVGAGAVLAGQKGKGKRFAKHSVGKGTAAKKPNKWMEHLKEFKKAHPELSHKEAMVKAKDSYKK